MMAAAACATAYWGVEIVLAKAVILERAHGISSSPRSLRYNAMAARGGAGPVLS